MELSSCNCKTFSLALALLIVASQFLHGLGCITEPGSPGPGATREEAKQPCKDEAEALRLQLRSRSAQTHEMVQHGRGLGAASRRPSGTSGASAFPAVIPPSNAGGFGSLQRDDGQAFAPAAFESVARLGLARKLLQGASTKARSEPSCKSSSYQVGCPPTGGSK